MGRLQKKGKAGAARAYVTRSAAVRKLQVTLADFRRLCILKGIFPREPRSRKKANKGSTAPTSFYYAKDIAYLAHEPILEKLREHKTFARKLARALGRGEWSTAKSLDEQKPVYRLDHIIKERYPTFVDAVRDIDDALCLIFVFANLPTHPRVPSSLIENCSRLAAEWQLYVMRTKSLRKVFLSIKGIYYQAEIMGQTITWIVPYQFTQRIPTDVDVRVMLTFLELYQTLLGFVFFKLYGDLGLVYPPPLDVNKDEAGAGVGAYALQESTEVMQDSSGPKPAKVKKVDVDGKTVTGKDVKKAIKAMGDITLESSDEVQLQSVEIDQYLPTAEEFVAQPSSGDTSTLPTLHALSTLPSNIQASLFAPYTIFLSRETPRSILEFVIRSFGGKVGWPETVGSGSPFNEDDESITHVIIDRPPIIPADPNDESSIAPISTSKPLTEKERRRKYVQPQWIVDCINAGRILLEEPYGRGKILPPHLSPFGEGEGAYDPNVDIPTAVIDTNAKDGAEVSSDEDEDMIEGEDEPDIEEDDEEDVSETEAAEAVAKPLLPPMPKNKTNKKSKKIPLVDASTDADLLRKAELQAERAGIEPAIFEEQLKKATKKSKKDGTAKQVEDDATVTMHNGVQANVNKMLMSNKKRKLYERMKHSQKVKSDEKAILERKKASLVKQKRKEGWSGKA